MLASTCLYSLYVWFVCYYLQYIVLVAIVFAGEVACGIVAIIYKDEVSLFIFPAYISICKGSIILYSTLL